MKAKSLRIPLLTHQGYESGYVDRRRTRALTRRSDDTGANTGRAMLVLYMIFILIAEMANRRKNGIGSSLPQTAKRGLFYLLAHFDQFLYIALFALTTAYFIQNLKHTLGSDAAWSAFTARLLLDELHKEPGDVDHACVVVHRYQTAGAHYGAKLLKRLVVQRHVQMLFRHASTGWSAELRGLEGLSVLHAVAYIVNKFTKSGSDRNFRESRVVYVTSQCENLGSLALLRSERGEPIAAV